MTRNTNVRQIVYTALYVMLCIAAPDLPIGALKMVGKSIGQFALGFASGSASGIKDKVQEVPGKILEDVKNTPKEIADTPRKIWENLNPFDGKFNE
jgi:hypothetical protein